MMDNKQKAIELFGKQFNCAQATFAALADEVGISREMALKTAACFGGGMRCGEVCGAVTGALMALGFRFGSTKENDPDGKAAAYKRSIAFTEAFKAKHGTILCRELLGFNPGLPEDADKIKELNLHEKICHGAIADAVEIAEAIIAQG
jgi:C_GCAxxG_C_C family probable redox protein